MNRQSVIFEDWGLIDFKEAWERQSRLSRALIEDKRSTPERVGTLQHRFAVCEHPPVFTLGKSGSEDNLNIPREDLNSIGASYYAINRGGDITYHGPGQLVGYPILDLDRFFTDVHKYVRFIEECIIRLLAEFQIQGERLKGYTGVWIASDKGEWRKICAIGVHLSRWVTMHGFALNVNTDLSYFDYIIPCGISELDKTVTTLSKEVGEDIGIDLVKDKLRDIFADQFDCDIIIQQLGHHAST